MFNNNFEKKENYQNQMCCMDNEWDIQVHVLSFDATFYNIYIYVCIH